MPQYDITTTYTRSARGSHEKAPLAIFFNNPTCCSMQTLELEVARELEAAGVETRTVKRTEYNDDVVR